MKIKWAAALMCPLLAAQDAPTFRADVALVHVDAEVVEEGRILGGLSQNDFRILDEGKPEPVVYFSAGEQALDLILLFDISGSMRFAVQEVASAAHQALTELRAGDRVAVMVFNTKARELAGFTEDLTAIEKTIDDVLQIRFGGGTFIQAAVDAAALRFRGEPTSMRRRAVLIVTDNMGTRTRREQSVVRDFWEVDAVLSGLIASNRAFRAIHTVGVITGPQNLLMAAGMKGIAAKTGGDSIGVTDAGAAFQESMRRIRSRYSLYYTQPDARPGSIRSIRVELTGEAAKLHPKAHVRARTGYVVPKR